MTLNVTGTQNYSNEIFGYTVASDDDMYINDLKELYSRATKNRPTKKLVVFGGLHGYGPGGKSYSGEPVGQDKSEKSDWSIKNDEYAKKGVGSSINFTYKNVAKYTTNGSDVSPEKQAELIQLAKDYADSGDWIVMFAWCYSAEWLNREGL
jgi:hypothetical protein